MQWLQQDLMRMTILGSFVLCLAGCALAALLARLSRRSQIPRFLRAMVTTVLCAWIFLIGGGGHGPAVGVLPSAFMMAISFRDNILVRAEDYVILAIAIFSFAAVFASFWFFSRLAAGEKS